MAQSVSITNKYLLGKIEYIGVSNVTFGKEYVGIARFNKEIQGKKARTETGDAWSGGV